VELLPKAQDTSFTRILLGFSGEMLQRMGLDDSFGQVTRLRFQHAQRNPEISPAQFRFKPPAGVDVVGDTD
jgi:outer membrane lipoprotein carrier protein